VEWVSGQSWCTDANGYARNVVASIERLLEKDPQGNVSDGQCDTLLISANEDRNNTIDELDDEYQVLMEKIVSKSMRDPAAQLIWWKQRVFSLEIQLALHDKIQDTIDKLVNESKEVVPLNKVVSTTIRFMAKVKTYIQRIDQYQHTGKLNYDGWVIFNNQLVTLIGRNELVVNPRYETIDTADKLAFYTRRMEEVKAAKESEFLENTVVETSLDVLDNDLLPPEQVLVSHVEE
jgi:uncharacterized coiled-coil protein SlyX